MLSNLGPATCTPGSQVDLFERVLLSVSPVWAGNRSVGTRFLVPENLTTCKVTLPRFSVGHLLDSEHMHILNCHLMAVGLYSMSTVRYQGRASTLR